MIRLVDVVKRYPQSGEALSGVSLDIGAGEMVYLTGHSGAGKTTLLRLLAGLEACTSGQVIVGGKNVGRMSATVLPHYRRRVGLVFQDHKLLPDRSVFDNVALPMVIAGAPTRDVRSRVRAALERVGLGEREAHFPTTLSSGEQQRVGIARAVVSRPPILLADEPTGNLDPTLSREVMSLFRDFNQLGTTVVIATHELALIDALPTRSVQLRQGRCVDDGFA
ncbi:MAG: cell division ATP-binding protein FtsE [Gammaproteobacteria bacterium]|nr:cell division ATP-binding protein FtsE [Gammaproteobacteria bacterium]